MSTFDEQTDRLRDLYERYVERVNGALRGGHDRRAQALSDEYVDEALRLILDDAAAAGHDRPAPNG